MKVNVEAVLTALDGEHLKVDNGEGVKPLTLKEVSVAVLLMPEDGLTGEQKMQRAELARSIYTATGEAEIAVGDVALLKDLIGKTQSPLVVMGAWNILDPK